MCGRYAITLPPEAVRAFFSYVEQPNFPARYNIAPTQPIPIVRRERDSGDASLRHFRLVRWGFVPAFVKDFGAFRPLINARSDGVAEKPSFRNAFNRRRCLVIADAFYEWQPQSAGRRQAYLVRRPDRQPFALGGLTETWTGADGSEIDTACIVTTDANGALAGVHPRMPVLIDPAAFDLWLDPDERTAREAAQLMRPAPDDLLEAVAIGPRVNKVAHDDSSIQEPIAQPDPTTLPDRSPRPEAPGRQGTLF